jgi:uroporphyrinogen decarboxylase
MTTITPRERVWQAIRHQQPDRVPYHFGYTAPARRKAEAHYGTTDLDHLLGDHLMIYSTRRHAPWKELRPGYWRDEFGVVWNRTIDVDIGVVDDYPLKGRSLQGCSIPDARDPRRYEDLPRLIAAYADRFRVAQIGFSLFERAWSLRSMPELLVDMLEAPAWVDELLDALVAFDLGVIDHVLQYDIDAIFFGDDWGHQQGLLMGPHLWRRFIKPRIRELYAAVKRAGKAVLIHSCGKVQELFPELIELGLDVFNPLQPEVMDPYEIKRRFGHELSFFGGMSIQQVLPHGTPQVVRDEARRLMERIGQGGGYIIAPAHDMPGDIPIENMVAFIETVRAG